MKYDILTANSAAVLASKVQQALDTGWELYGPMAVSNYVYSQPVVKYPHICPLGGGRPA